MGDVLPTGWTVCRHARGAGRNCSQENVLVILGIQRFSKRFLIKSLGVMVASRETMTVCGPSIVLFKHQPCTCTGVFSETCQTLGKQGTHAESHDDGAAAGDDDGSKVSGEVFVVVR